MTNYGNGNYTITARSGREYLVTYSGHALNSSVFSPEFWHAPFRTLGLSWYPGSGHSLGGGSARWVDFKARRVIARLERRLNRADRRARASRRFLDSRGPGASDSGSDT